LPVVKEPYLYPLTLKTFTFERGVILSIFALGTIFTPTDSTLGETEILSEEETDGLMLGDADGLSLGDKGDGETLGDADGLTLALADGLKL